MVKPTPLHSQASKASGHTRAAYAARDTALIGIMAGLLTAVKQPLAVVPGVEGVTLLLMVYTLTVGWKRAAVAALLFSTIQVLFYGINSWLLMYYINWPLLVLATHGVSILLRPYYRRAHTPKKEARTKLGRLWRSHSLPVVCYALVCGIFGFTFGFLCALVQPLFYSGNMGYFAYAIVYWLNGLTFDAIHGISNFVIGLFLIVPLSTAFGAVKKRLRLFSHIQ